MTLTLTVTNRIAALQGSPVIVCGNSDYSVQVVCDAEWAAYAEKTLQIAYVCRGETVRINAAVQPQNNTASLPAIPDASELFLGLQAGEIRTAAPARIPCIACICSIPAEYAVPYRDFYNETMQTLADLAPRQVLRLLRDADGYVLRDSSGKVIRLRRG